MTEDLMVDDAAYADDDTAKINADYERKPKKRLYPSYAEAMMSAAALEENKAVRDFFAKIDWTDPRLQDLI